MALDHMEWAACMGRPVWTMMVGARQENKQELKGGLIGSARPYHSPFTGTQTCIPRHPALFHVRACNISRSSAAGTLLQRRISQGKLMSRG